MAATRIRFPARRVVAATSLTFSALLAHCGSSEQTMPSGGPTPFEAGTNDGTAAGQSSPDGSARDGSTDGGAVSAPANARLTAGVNFTCAIVTGGVLKCWGYNFFGQLGLGDTADRGDAPGEMGASLPAVDLGVGRTVTSVSAGTEHACALLDDGTVKCWGGNRSGQLGRGDALDRGGSANQMGTNLAAIDLGPGRKAIAVAAGGEHSCALLDDGALKCWGLNEHGQLGLGDTQARGDEAGEMGAALPGIDLGPGRKAWAVVANGHSTCARLDDGTVKCWGRNDVGALGLGDRVERGSTSGQMGANLPAVNLGPGETVTLVSSSSLLRPGAVDNSHTCAVVGSGALKCWGFNAFGALGLGDKAFRGAEPSTMGASLPAVSLGTGRTVKGLAVGGWHTCALLDDATVKCWGVGASGVLGLGSTSNRGEQAAQMGDALPAIDFGAGRTAVAISSGSTHSCAFLDNGEIKCWGRNSRGQLGVGDVQDRGDLPGEMGDALASVHLQ